MKDAELKAINFKDSLRVCYEEIEPFLLKELDSLRDKLLLLPESSSEEIKLNLFKETVENLNELENNESLECRIDTEEREGLCDALYKMGNIVGLDESTDFVDEWREW